MKNLSKSFTNKIVLSILSVLMVACLIVMATLTSHIVYAEETSANHYRKATTTISNSSFQSYTSSNTDGMPYIPSSWTKTNSGDVTVKSGIVNLRYEFTTETVGLEETQKPLTPNSNLSSGDAQNYNLMINAESKSLYYGYKSPSFTLSANRYYEIDVVVKTINDAHASIKLTGLDRDAQILSIDTTAEPNGGWGTYRIFIATSSIDDETVSLELYLGDSTNEKSSGAVFFNSATLYELSQATFHSYTDVEETDSLHDLIVDLKKDEAEPEVPFENADFESGTLNNYDIYDEELGTSLTHSRYVITTNAAKDTEEYHQVGSPNIADEQYILYMENKESTYQSLKSASFELNPQSYYRLSFWAKTNITTASITLSNEDASISTAINPTSSTSNLPAGGYTNYAFYIQTPNKAVSVYYIIALGTQDSKCLGYMAINGFTLQRVSYNDYTNGVAANTSTNKALNLNNTDTTTNFLVSNGAFNQTNNQSLDATYPADPRDWTFETSDEVNDLKNSPSGVVNTNTNAFKDLQAAGVPNPGLTPLQHSSLDEANNNVLMIQNKYVADSSYTTAKTFTLNSSTYYKVEVLVNTSKIISGGAYISIYSTDATYYDMREIDTSSVWQNYAFYIYTGNMSLTLNIKLGLNGVGFAFFDNVIVTTSNQTSFDAAYNLNNLQNYAVNLDKEDFRVYTVNPQHDSLYTLNNWKMTVNDGYANVKNGVLVLNDAQQMQNLEYNLVKKTNDRVFVIDSPFDTYYTAKSTYPISLASGKFYTIKVTMLTTNIMQQTNNKAEDYGVSIKLDNIDKAFENIKSSDNYVTYTFAIQADQTLSTYINFIMGAKDAMVSGQIFVDSIEVSEVDNLDDYNEDQENVIVYTATTPETDDETTNSSRPHRNFGGSELLWSLLPSLLFFLAIVIALVGFGIRKIKRPRKSVKIEHMYDRRNKNDINLSDRDQINVRQKLIADLKNQIRLCEADLNEAESQYKEDKEKIDAKDVKQNKKLEDEYKNKRNAINTDIASLEDKIKTLNTEIENIRNKKTAK